MYTGYELSDESKNELLKIFPPKYKRVVAHHITYEFGVPRDSDPPKAPKDVNVIGYVDSGEGVEGLVVEVDEEERRPDGKRYHITWSLDEGRRAVETNKYTEKFKPVNKISIKVTPKTFTR